jgi:hypothetical protein
VPCLFAVLALLTPRIAIVLLYLFTHWFHGVFRGQFPPILWMALGLVFAPTTLLWYTAVMHWFGGQWTLVTVIGLIIAIIIDVSPASGRRRRYVVEE